MPARQSSIISSLLKSDKKKFQIHVYGNKIIKRMRNEFKNKVKYRKFDNIIHTKNLDGSLSLSKTKKYLIFGKKIKNLIKGKIKSNEI